MVNLKLDFRNSIKIINAKRNKMNCLFCHFLPTTSDICRHWHLTTSWPLADPIMCMCVCVLLMSVFCCVHLRGHRRVGSAFLKWPGRSRYENPGGQNKYPLFSLLLSSITPISPIALIHALFHGGDIDGSGVERERLIVLWLILFREKVNDPDLPLLLQKFFSTYCPVWFLLR